MNQAYFADIEWLISQPQWATYKKLLEDECQTIVSAFEHDTVPRLEDLQQRLKQTRKIMRMPYDLVKEQKESEKK